MVAEPIINSRTGEVMAEPDEVRTRAGFEVRDVHYSHYGRMCPVETPEAVSYTHLDVYKRQPSGKKFVIFSSLLLSGTWVRTCLLYTSRCV